MAVKKAAPLKKLAKHGAVTFLYLKRPGGVIGSLANLNSITIYMISKTVPILNNEIIIVDPHEYF